MEPFNIFPIESLMLGLAFGEHKRLSDAGIYESFEKPLYRRVHPYVPDLRQPIDVQLDASMVPEDIIFRSTIDGDFRRQYSSLDGELYSKSGSRFFRQEWDVSRKSFLDLLMLFLTSDNPEPCDCWGDVPHWCEERWDPYRADGASDRIHKDTEAIEALLLRLVRANDKHCHSTYSLGNKLGKVFADCLRMDTMLLHMEYNYYGHTAPKFDVLTTRSHRSIEAGYSTSVHAGMRCLISSWQIPHVIEVSQSVFLNNPGNLIPQ